MKRYSLYQFKNSPNQYTLVYNGNPPLVTLTSFTLNKISTAMAAPKIPLPSDRLDEVIHQLDFDNFTEVDNLIETNPELFI